MMQQEFTSPLIAELRANNGILQRGDITLRLAENFGFCWGVERAVCYKWTLIVTFKQTSYQLLSFVVVVYADINGVWGACALSRQHHPHHKWDHTQPAGKHSHEDVTDSNVVHWIMCFFNVYKLCETSTITIYLFTYHSFHLFAGQRSSARDERSVSGEESKRPHEQCSSEQWKELWER